MDPFAAGDFYPGDLLNNLLGIPKPFWTEHPSLHQEASDVAATANARLQEFEHEQQNRVRDSLRKALDEFLAGHR